MRLVRMGSGPDRRMEIFTLPAVGSPPEDQPAAGPELEIEIGGLCREPVLPFRAGDAAADLDG
jgi:hypothetical protein